MTDMAYCEYEDYGEHNGLINEIKSLIEDEFVTRKYALRHELYSEAKARVRKETDDLKAKLAIEYKNNSYIECEECGRVFKPEKYMRNQKGEWVLKDGFHEPGRCPNCNASLSNHSLLERNHDYGRNMGSVPGSPKRSQVIIEMMESRGQI